MSNKAFPFISYLADNLEGIKFEFRSERGEEIQQSNRRYPLKMPEESLRER